MGSQTNTIPRRSAVTALVRATFIMCALSVFQSPAQAQSSVSVLKAPVCMGAEELEAYQAALTLATVGAILGRCKASFANDLDPGQIRAVEDANIKVATHPGAVIARVNELVRAPFRRAYPGREASIFADVLQGDLEAAMGRARAETIESCRKVIGLWSGKIAEGAWEEHLVQLGTSAFKRNVIRRRPAFPACK